MAREILPAKHGFKVFSDLELTDEIDNLMMQSSALVMNTYGGSGEGFRGMNEEYQDAYLFAVHGMLIRLEAIWGELGDRRRASAKGSMDVQP